MDVFEQARQLFLEALDLIQGKDYLEAENRLRQADHLVPQRSSVLTNLSAVLFKLGRFSESRSYARQALDLDRKNVHAWINLCLCLESEQRVLKAHEAVDEALAILPDVSMLWFAKASILGLLNQDEEALGCFDHAIALDDTFAEAWCQRGILLRHMSRFDEALQSLDKALVLNPEYAEAHFNRATLLHTQWRHGEAAQAYERVLALNPEFSFAKGEAMHSRMLACDWHDFEYHLASLEQDVLAGKPVVEPFGYQAMSESVIALQRCARTYVAEKFRVPDEISPLPPVYANRKIRIGYLAGEFRQQATSILMVELFEKHDYGNFEVYCFDNGWDDGSDIRHRISVAVTEIVDISHLGDEEAVEQIRSRRIDILVNLNGYFGLGRPGVFARRAAPVQANYLGFPGTIGADHIDYIIADRHVIPAEEQAAYTEKVVYLPDCYQVNDSQRPIAPLTKTRSDCGLPEQGFVFCCFNNSYKITPKVFDVWMRLLQRVPGSVMWLLENRAETTRNLLREVQARGVEPERLVFAPRARPEEHLARHALADLFLDTLPYNAHTTASDALWAGLPLVTCYGSTFPGRVASSLLYAIGLDELVTHSLAEYEALALALAGDPERLSAIRARLWEARKTSSLFDADRFARHIETAFRTMRNRYEAGEHPACFAIPA